MSTDILIPGPDHNPAPKAPAADYPALPLAELILPASAPREVWKEHRSHGVGASDASAILEVQDPELAKGIYKDRYLTWLDKTGQAQDWEPDRDHPAHIGNVMEPVLRAELQHRVGATIHTPGLFQCRRNPVLRFTPDGIHTDPETGELVLDEFKNNGGFQGIKQWADPDKTPLHPLAQVQFTMHASGIRKAIVFALAGGNRWERRDIDYNPELGQMIEDQVMDFWENNVLAMRQPDATRLSLETLAKSFGAALPGKEHRVDADLARVLTDDFIEAKELADRGKNRREDVNARIRALVQDAEMLVGPDGEVLFTVANDSTLRKKDLLAEHPDLMDRYGKDERVLDVAKLKAEDPDLYNRYRARSVKLKGGRAE